MGTNFFAVLVSNANNAIATLADRLPKTPEDVSKAAEDALDAAKDGIGMVAKVVTNTAGAAANAAVHQAQDLNQAIQENSRENVVKRAKVAAFQDGINQGAYMMANSVYAYSFALVALTTYAARCDREMSSTEIVALQDRLHHLQADTSIPLPVREKLLALATNESITFDDVTVYLDEVDTTALRYLYGELESVIEADGVVTPEEEALRQEFSWYYHARMQTEAAGNE